MSDHDPGLEAEPDAGEVFGAAAGACAPLRAFHAGGISQRALQLLSNGRYRVALGAAGTGYSRWNELALTRWQADPSGGEQGAFCYLREAAGGRFWSCGRQPAPHPDGAYRSAFWDAGVALDCRADGLDSRLAVALAPDDDVELRRLTLVNRSATARLIEATSLAEVVLGPAAADDAHPAFAKLFVETEILPELRAILCTRRSGSGSNAPWMFHLLTPIDAAPTAPSYETDRMAFIGRGHSAAAPQALLRDGPLAGHRGAVLDPIVAIRAGVALAPGGSASLAFITGAAPSRAACLALIGKYREPAAATALFGLAWARSREALRQLRMDDAAAALAGRLADAIVGTDARLRGDPAAVLQNRRGQSGLWGMAISGDWPIVLLQLGADAQPALLEQMLRAHAYWRAKGLMVDLVICGPLGAPAQPALQERVLAQVAAVVAGGASLLDRPGGIFVRLAAALAPADQLLLQAVARVVLEGNAGTLAEQLARRCGEEREPASPQPQPVPIQQPLGEPPEAPAPREDLLFFNGLGGFSKDGREYVVTLAPGQVTPLPWINVLANPTFGSLVSADGGACTWSENAQEFRLTPWTNDVIRDLDGEAFYLRDDDSGGYWSPTPSPRRGAGRYVCRHGFGYSLFSHREQGIESELRVYVATDAALKFAVLTLRNRSGRPRRLSATAYVEWVLGELRQKTMAQIVTSVDPDSGALLARNGYSDDFGGRVAFLDGDLIADDGADNGSARSFTCDRGEFIGGFGSPRQPRAMSRARLSGRCGALLDPCAALSIHCELAAGGEREIVFRLGAAASEEEARELIRRQRLPSAGAAARRALAAVNEQWQATLGALQVETPDPAFDLLANGWLPYQTLACRLWARNAFYQSSGAFGFRDQLQDAMALAHAAPGLLREHLLRCAGRQFREGDVQHWWHPPSGRGVRTRCSDDFLWLPHAVCRYVTVSGDAAVLDESVDFLDARPLREGEESYYDLPRVAGESATLYQHCVRAIRHGLRFGAHGLPLMGSGDWNDGMNKVGIGGRGESVWLGFFLYAVLLEFAGLAEARGDQPFGADCRARAAALRLSLEQHGWDGAWYRRAYFDDGQPLGAAANAECRIDSIAQSWAVLSGAADPGRARMAMEAVRRQLLETLPGGGALLKLLAPPFDRSTPDPGYIQAYVPGVRENGAQYTHAAVWALMAFAALGEGERASRLLSAINPVNHARDRESLARYEVEPYVLASDVYALAPHGGRGGWTWYTGSAGWMLRLMTESILGLRREAGTLYLEPRLPADWRGFRARYRYGATCYSIDVLRTGPEDGAEAGALSVTVDGVAQHGSAVALRDDRRPHQVEVRSARARPGVECEENEEKGG